jgi:hypothetical protein
MAVYRHTTGDREGHERHQNFTVARVHGRHGRAASGSVTNAGTTLIAAPATATGSAPPPATPEQVDAPMAQGSAATARSVTAFASKALV